MTALALSARASRTLFTIGLDLEALDALLDEAGGDVTDPAVNAAVTGWITSLHAERGAKLTGFFNLIRRLEHEEVAAAAMVTEWTVKRGARRRRIDAVKGLLKTFMEQSGLKSMDSDGGVRFLLAANGGPLPVRIADADMIPVEYLKTVVSSDMSKIRDALELGESVPGACLVERGTHLRIK